MLKLIGFLYGGSEYVKLLKLFWWKRVLARDFIEAGTRCREIKICSWIATVPGEFQG